MIISLLLGVPTAGPYSSHNHLSSLQRAAGHMGETGEKHPHACVENLPTALHDPALGKHRSHVVLATS